MNLPPDFKDLERMLCGVPGVVAVRTDCTLESVARPLVCVDTQGKGGTFRFQVSRSPAGIDHFRRQLPAGLAQELEFPGRAADLFDAHPFQEWPLVALPAGQPMAANCTAPLWQALASSPVDRVELRVQASETDRRAARKTWVQAFACERMLLSVGWAALVNATRVVVGSSDSDSVSHLDGRLRAWTQALGIGTDCLVDTVAALSPLVLLGPPARYVRSG
ncbi:hypothetical protein [Aquimonas sp.]|jgi:hypothetical protein|uniref:hypothetical protein n=1 Tax=Aquimonas sp. TaxID=1872588 RepID=UPI0037BEDA39